MEAETITPVLVEFNLEAWVHPERRKAVLEEIENALTHSAYVSDFAIEFKD